uniref:Uncharacterized protein n=1 Tax=Romanomermis culicivorax TaxID=13658 RepID=A0A915IWC9_ROMCU
MGDRSHENRSIGNSLICEFAQLGIADMRIAQLKCTYVIIAHLDSVRLGIAHMRIPLVNRFRDGKFSIANFNNMDCVECSSNAYSGE